MGAGCAQIHILVDNQVCSAVLGIFQTFLKTFGFFEPIEDSCMHRNLLTCDIIRSSVAHMALVAIIGGLLASVLSFQMLIDSATKHERARCKRIMQEEGLMKRGWDAMLPRREDIFFCEASEWKQATEKTWIAWKRALELQLA